MGVDNKIFQEYIVQTCLFTGCEATGYLLDVLDNAYVNNALTKREKKSYHWFTRTAFRKWLGLRSSLGWANLLIVFIREDSEIWPWGSGRLDILREGRRWVTFDAADVHKVCHPPCLSSYSS